MNMALSVLLCVLFFTTFVFQQAMARPKTAKSYPNIGERHIGERIRRGSLHLVVSLLRSAKRIIRPVTSPVRSSVFVKSGGYRQAELDFYSLRPTDIVIKRNGKIGKVGGNEVDLRRTDGGKAWLSIHSFGRNPDGMPVITVRAIRYDD